jgi:HAD superfamily hydrolase (TIGR01509 family)
MPGEIKAVVFDMDGVLVDAKEWHYLALNRALQLFGYEIERYDHLITYDGLPTRRKLEILSRDNGLPPALHGFINELKQLYTTELVHVQCKPSFQHQYALSRLKAEGYLLGVASNAVRASVELMMGKSNLTPYLDVLLSNEDVKKAKPDPEIYTTALARLGVAPQAAVVVEDNEHGVQAARASGAHVLVVESFAGVTYDAIAAQISRVEGAAA